VHEEGFEPPRFYPPEPKADRSVQDDACRRNLDAESAGTSAKVREGPPRSAGVGRARTQRRYRSRRRLRSSAATVAASSRAVRTTTPTGLARAVVAALEHGDLEGALASAEALVAFMRASGETLGSSRSGQGFGTGRDAPVGCRLNDTPGPLRPTCRLMRYSRLPDRVGARFGVRAAARAACHARGRSAE
jgi:hypothetical protein